MDLIMCTDKICLYRTFSFYLFITTVSLAIQFLYLVCNITSVKIEHKPCLIK